MKIFGSDGVAHSPMRWLPYGPMRSVRARCSPLRSNEVTSTTAGLSRQCGQLCLPGKSAVLRWLLLARYQTTHRPGLISYVCSTRHLEEPICPLVQKSAYTKLLSSQFYFMQQKPGLLVQLTSKLLKPSTWNIRDSCCRSAGNSSSEMTRLQWLPACRRSRKLSATVVTLSSVTLRDYNKMSRRTRPSTATSTCLLVDHPMTSGNVVQVDHERRIDQVRKDNGIPPADLWRRATSRGHRGATLRPSLALW